MKSDKNNKKTTLDVKKGIEQPTQLNPKLSVQFTKNKKKQKTVEEYISGILEGDRVVLGQAITLIESTREEHKLLAQEIIEKCLPHTGNSVRVGITGTPGVGKSTFIEAFGKFITSKGEKIAVLAIDPSSHFSRGSILGDKTRMEELSADTNAFIRPSPAGTSLGGVARKTRETIALCEAAGYEMIVIETVGVGQSEIAVHSMVDFFLLLLNPGAGDELQGIKRGIVEMADLVAVNKADGDMLTTAKEAKRAYWNALHLFPPKESNWTPQVVTCSALTGTGIDSINSIIQDFQQKMTESNWWQEHRQQQSKYWLEESIQEQLHSLFSQNERVQSKRAEIEKAVLNGQKSSFRAAEELLKLFKK